MKKLIIIISTLIIAMTVSFIGTTMSYSTNIIGQIVFFITLLPPLTYLIVSISKRSINLLDPFFLYPLCYFLFFGVGKLLASDVSDQAARTADLCIILGVFGYLYAFMFFKVVRKSNQGDMANKTIYFENSLFFEKIVFLIGTLAFGLYILRIGSIPLFMGNLEQSRVDASISGGAELRVLTYLLIISSIVGFYNYFFLKFNGITPQKSSLWIYIFGIIFLLLLSNRSPVFTIILSTFLIFVYLKFQGKIRTKNFILLGTVVLLTVVVFVGGIGAYRVVNTELFYRFPEYKSYLIDKDYIGLSLFIFGHYLGIGYKNFSDVLQLFPSVIPYEYGQTYLGPVLTVLPGTQYTLDMQIKEALGQSYLGGGTIPSALGEAYANFGLIGCFIIPFFTFLLLNAVFISFKKDPKNPFKIIFYVFFLVYMSYNLLAGYAATSVFPFISIGVYFCYRVLLYTPVSFIKKPSSLDKKEKGRWNVHGTSKQI